MVIGIEMKILIIAGVHTLCGNVVILLLKGAFPESDMSIFNRFENFSR